MTAMHLLALIGDNGIGRLGYRVPDGQAPAPAVPIPRQALLRTPFTARVFDELVNAYLATGIGVAGMQPKIMVPDRATIPIPNLIIKTAGAGYPGLAANGQRLGFEDVAALMGLRVRDTLSERKYHGSYQRVAELLGIITGNHHDLQRFFEQLAFSIMVGNGDAHLKNFGVLYHGVADGPRLAPMFDVVTTRIYRYQRSPSGPELEDHTLALRLWSGKARRSKAYPLPEELHRFGRDVCGVRDPQRQLNRIAEAMAETLHSACSDPRIPADLLAQLRPVWENGMRYG